MTNKKRGLKWKKDGTAVCGPVRVQVVQTYKGCRGVNWRAIEEVSGWSEDANSRADARECAESWLRKQAAAMQRALGEEGR